MVTAAMKLKDTCSLEEKLESIGLQNVGHDLATEQQQKKKGEKRSQFLSSLILAVARASKQEGILTYLSLIEG